MAFILACALLTGYPNSKSAQLIPLLFLRDKTYRLRHVLPVQYSCRQRKKTGYTGYEAYHLYNTHVANAS